MRYAGIIKNDMSAAPGICLSFFVQGCPNHCEGCHNPESWDFDGGKEFTPQVLDEILNGLYENGIERTLCIMGGEPLCEENLFLTMLVIKTAKEKYPDLKVAVWTGYVYDNLIRNPNQKLKYILSNTNILVDGPYIDSLRDITLPMRGSSNQRVLYLKETDGHEKS